MMSKTLGSFPKKYAQESKQNSKEAPPSNKKYIPSQLVESLQKGQVLEETQNKPQIIQFLNLADYSIYPESSVLNDEPLFEPIPPVIYFNDFEALQIKEKIFRLKNKDAFIRKVKVIPPDNRLFQVFPARASSAKEKNKTSLIGEGNKVAPGMDIAFIIKFQPEDKKDFRDNLIIVTEREKFLVPLIAVGRRAIIECPDVIDFGLCPVKQPTEKPIHIRNLGDKPGKWHLQCPSCFQPEIKEGILEGGRDMQVLMKFQPQEAKSYSAESTISQDNLTAYIILKGIAQNGNVFLSKSYLQLEDAQIGLKSQQTLQIINKSNVKVEFQWRSMKTEKEEIEIKNKMRFDLEEDEKRERMVKKDMVISEEEEPRPEEKFEEYESDESIDEKAMILRKQKKEDLIVMRKYKNLKKGIEEFMLFFKHDMFKIEPLSGQIWPNSEMTITISFLPRDAQHYSCVAYCNISCSENRLPLHIVGEGIGPKAFLSTSEITIGDITITDEFKTEILIENRGDIDANFELLQNNSNFAQMFSFDVTKGKLAVWEKAPINVKFCSKILGEVNETFFWKLHGSHQSLSLHFVGHVIAPTFQFNADFIDFGKVSYSFRTVRKITLFNTSPVPFKFALRIPLDGKLKQKEFEIKPSRDILGANCSVDIDITFTSLTAQKQDMVMVLDLEGIGQDMHSIAIKAESEVPTVKIDPPDILALGTVFLRNPNQTVITLINESNLLAKYEILPQKEDSKVLGEFTVDPQSGTIEKFGKVTIAVNVITKRPNEINIPLHINIEGNKHENPKIISIQATSIGPIVEVEPKEIDFGRIPVLIDTPARIKITNKSKIEADFDAFTKNKPSWFKVIQKHGVLQPGETMEIDVRCMPDDQDKFNDILHFVIKEGVDVDVILKAVGEGSTIYWTDKIENINFGIRQTHKEIVTDIHIENKGRKPQLVEWALDTKEMAKKTEDQKSSYNPEDTVFTVDPPKKLIPPKMGFMFQIKGKSSTKGNKKEIQKLTTITGNARRANEIATSIIEADFILPTLSFGSAKMPIYFKQTWEKNVPMTPISKVLDITCTSQLPTNFKMHTFPPFSINKDSLALLPNQTAQVRVDFDPSFKNDDRISGKIEGKLFITHIGHPHKETIELLGEFSFPNLKFDNTSNKILFGSILNETSKKQKMIIENISEIDVNYEWTLLEDEKTTRLPRQQTLDIGSPESKKEQQKPKFIALNEVFDILPLKGTLKPKETDKVEFIFNALTGVNEKATAVCYVDGGPHYDFELLGDSSLQQRQLSTWSSQNKIDFGEPRFNEWVQREFVIENTGKVTFDYKISTQHIKRKGFFEIKPTNGEIDGGKSQKFFIKLCPAMPDKVKEFLDVEIGYFPKETIEIIGQAKQPGLITTLSRVETDDQITALDEVKGEKAPNELELINQGTGMFKKMSVKLDETSLNLESDIMSEATGTKEIRPGGPFIFINVKL